jgi:hypothetical protein
LPKYPTCKQETIKGDDSVWAMCGDIPVYKWGMGKKTVANAIGNCNYEAGTKHKWGKCSDAIKTYYQIS